jgi:hypothetical protein
VGNGELKVTDKRMFTPDGELREEYRHLERNKERETAPPPAAEEPREPPAAPEPPAGESPPRLEIPGTPEELGAPGFVDLVTLLAEPIALYLGDVELPDGRSAENLEMARVHIDLLDVLRRRTAGNLTAEESALLEDLLYRCRLRYVQKRG